MERSEITPTEGGAKVLVRDDGDQGMRSKAGIVSQPTTHETGRTLVGDNVAHAVDGMQTTLRVHDH